MGSNAPVIITVTRKGRGFTLEAVSVGDPIAGATAPDRKAAQRLVAAWRENWSGRKLTVRGLGAGRPAKVADGRSASVNLSAAAWAVLDEWRDDIRKDGWGSIPKDPKFSRSAALEALILDWQAVRGRIKD